MKNLHVTQTIKVELSATIVGQCIDTDNRRFFLLTEDVAVFEVQDDQQIELPINAQTSLGICRIKPDDLITIEYLVESGSIFVATKSGQFLRIGVSSFSPPTSCVYAHKRPLCSVKFSPDQDLIALADVENDLYILAADYSIAHASNALTECDSAHKPVGVGWGSKETQFFGLDGRPSREKSDKDLIVLSEEELSALDKIESSASFKSFLQSNEKDTVVDWRGDGQLLATFTFIPDSGKHYLKVWNRNLELQYMSEQLVTMERGLLSWVPSGQYVCTATRRNNRINEIAMFEKNGMVHQRITLPTFIPHLYIKDLMWSPDSAVLAIVAIRFDIRESECHHRQLIMLYTMQNFHYYLKYSSYLTFGESDYSLRWDPNHNNILYITSGNGRCIQLNCTHLVDYRQEEASVMVVDGNKILLTPFEICNIPPPMAASVLELDSLINRIVISSKSPEQMFVITIDHKIIYRITDSEQKSNYPTFTFSACIKTEEIEKFNQKLGPFSCIDFKSSNELQNLTNINSNTFIATRWSHSGTELFKISIEGSGHERLLEYSNEKLVIEREVINIVRSSYRESLDSVLIILDDFSCDLVDFKSCKRFTRFRIASATDRLYIKETEYVPSSDLVLSLTVDQTLRVEDRVIASNCCTSFRTTTNFIIFTTTDHNIHIVPLDKLQSKSDDDYIGSWNQPIETGGILVMASEYNSKVILQMPRGNLEILHPRILVLLRIINYLDQEEYLPALKLARRYRVDLNFLADHMIRFNKRTFYAGRLNDFANCIAKYDSALINLFITELTPEDTTRGRYKQAMEFLPTSYRSISDAQAADEDDKVNMICSTITLPCDLKYLQPRILCLLKQEPRKSCEALTLIHKMESKEEREAALKFMLYFISIDELFADAIATYDTDIAIMVASVSSKDPKEYLALLDSFNDIENVHLRRHKMDCHIKNYEKAFTNLLIYLQDAPDKAVTKSELFDLMVTKRIYRHAVKACFDQFVNFVSLCGEQCSVDKTFEELSMETWVRYGDYLLEKRYYLEAGLAYGKSLARLGTDRKLESKIKCFMLADDWERCVAALEHYKLPEVKRREILKNISSSLMMQGHYAESILVTGSQKNDDFAFELVSKGSWHLAEFLVTDQSRARLRETIIESVCAQLNQQMIDLSDSIRSARDQFSRIKDLLLEPPKADNFDADNCFNGDSLSTIDGSETSSLLSARNNQGHVARSGAPSIKTRASTKSNKSQVVKRKKINLKLGSRHEDMALVIELKKFVLKQKTNQESIRHLIAAQIEYTNLVTLDERHKSINDLLRQSHSLAREILSHLWPKNDSGENIYSVYKRFSKSLSTGDYIDNEDLELLMRPQLHESCLLLEF